jgi:hypothetical protein
MFCLEKVYCLLLKAYPARFREEYGREMLLLFGDQLRDARERGHVARFWLRTSADWLRTVLFEHVSQRFRKTRQPLPFKHVLSRGVMLAPSPGGAVLIAVAIIAYWQVRKLNFFKRRPRQ